MLCSGRVSIYALRTKYDVVPSKRYPLEQNLLGEPITKAAVYDLEQAIQDQVAEELLTRVLTGELALDELLADHFVRDLHRRLYGDIWSWAGMFRKRELNIGASSAGPALTPGGLPRGRGTVVGDECRPTR